MRTLWFWRAWTDGEPEVPEGRLHVSMNDYLVHRARDIPRVALAGRRFRRGWPTTPGALGLWVASSPGGRRQISVSVWRSPDDLRAFVHSPAHRRIMRDFRTAGALHTTPWTTAGLAHGEIWREAEARLRGRIPGAVHH
jgi:heme-degrading monooxygenase HmoA